MRTPQCHRLVAFQPDVIVEVKWNKNNDMIYQQIKASKEWYGAVIEYYNLCSYLVQD